MTCFANLYFDEDVSVVLARVLVGRGFGVLTARDARMLGRSDEEQLIFATKISRVIVTHNRRHFEELHAIFAGRQLEHAGMVVAGQRDVYEMARRVALRLMCKQSAKIRIQMESHGEISLPTGQNRHWAGARGGSVCGGS